jgi:hypothetical protein
MRRFQRRLLRLWRLLVEWTRGLATRVHASRNYGRAKRLAWYILGLMAASIADDVMTWLRHGL